jgi:hypothetical protein
MLIVLPLKYSETGRIRWEGKFQSLIYFASLGSGFIFLQIMLIQMFIRLIGYPLYTYIAVLFSMLVSAGIGSMAANKLNITPSYRWKLPFIGIVISGILLLILHADLIDQSLEISLTSRVAATVLMVFPLGFFLGMPFPLGILWLSDHPEGAIAWAWGINGLFTIFGGLFASIVSMLIGFDATFMIGIGIYCLAFFVMRKMCFKNTDPNFRPNIV